MIDIHSHILPNVDDGSDGMETSLAMLREAAGLGVSDIFLTPHYMRFRNYLSPSSINREIFSRVLEEVKREKLPIKLHLGNEIYYSVDMLDAIRKGVVLPLGDSDKILIEFSLLEEEDDIGEAIANVISLGYVPVIAHLERYPYVSKTKDYEIMKRMGALIQVNARSIVRHSDFAAHNKAMKLLKAGLVDFVASDQHRPGHNHMKEAYIFVSRKYGKQIAEKLFVNKSVIK